MTAIDPRPAVGPTLGGGSSLDSPQSLDSYGTRRRRSPRELVAAYVALTKPRIIELLLVTTIPTMLLAARGLPDLRVTLATLVGGYLAAGSANALNCYLDRDIDRVMDRTGSRPLATGVLSAGEALVFGLALGVASVALFWGLVNVLSAGLALAAIAFYVLVYTLLLKRRTPQNIVWGGAAGCMPVLIGWAAVTGSLSWAPLVLFAVVFFWTPPHYWPLAMRFREDYGRAGVPMLPVVATDLTVAKQVLAYSWAMVAASVALWPVAGTGWTYGVASLALGAAFLREAHGLLARARAGLSGASLKPMRLFHGSISYLSLLFLAVALAPFLP